MSVYPRAVRTEPAGACFQGASPASMDALTRRRARPAETSIARLAEQLAAL
ncbi:hypothetical protein ThrDRAFT_01992 [Frankia casuarinae]|uniref:hypothetical protein n=1 Tax=Frankia TaxID=1854 RepID=UPI000314781D|nr:MULTISPECIES: hypothetical protein [Frankia]ETA02217.1 hypothetical protein CcI6DRAFT_02392 [Frankia sp. CcI6]EYT92382.1 hypothetical protein ThrDRAFT_01992 [Frankia casuarinae]KFB06032.1 hypothetical protein ALLO2DRAFT_01317 [Frankia sp. Allo2]OAA28976.1 hypothetical protein AAY23_1018141 [Frankia casuarinae]